MEKKTLKFQCLINMASFSRKLSTGYLMNTNNFTLTGKFTEEEVSEAMQTFNAELIETSDKVFSYENL
jgi:hypothetical protein